MKVSDILYENGDYWVCQANNPDHGFEVYRVGITHSSRCAQIGNGPGPNLGLDRAIAECDRRVNLETNNETHIF